MDCSGVRRLYVYNLENWLLLKSTPPPSAVARQNLKTESLLLLTGRRPAKMQEPLGLGGGPD